MHPEHWDTLIPFCCCVHWCRWSGEESGDCILGKLSCFRQTEQNRWILPKALVKLTRQLVLPTHEKPLINASFLTIRYKKKPRITKIWGKSRRPNIWWLGAQDKKKKENRGVNYQRNENKIFKASKVLDFQSKKTQWVFSIIGWKEGLMQGTLFWKDPAREQIIYKARLYTKLFTKADYIQRTRNQNGEKILNHLMMIQQCLHCSEGIMISRL